MKQCYMLTLNEKNFLKYTIINTLRLTTNRKGAFHYATDVVIADKPEYIYLYELLLKNLVESIGPHIIPYSMNIKSIQ